MGMHDEPCSWCRLSVTSSKASEQVDICEETPRKAQEAGRPDCSETLREKVRIQRNQLRMLRDGEDQKGTD